MSTLWFERPPGPVEPCDALRSLGSFQVVAQQFGRVAAQGWARAVSYDYGTGAKAALPERVRVAIAELEGG